MLFVRAKSFRKKNKKFKTALITSFILLLKSIYVFISFCWIYPYNFVNSVVTEIPLIPYYYQLYKMPNKKQTDFQNLSHQKFTLYSYEKVFTCKNFICRKTSLLWVIKNVQPKIYLRLFYELLLLLMTDYSVTMKSHQGKKKMTFLIFLLYLYFTEQRKKPERSTVSLTVSLMRLQ